ncbi:unnamed protein product [Dracunculus medinensis]|uniref:CWH43-like N-terminal domain-containing protein n=1 Tax=Dracunculus medinensis TaxID=318479 RepID=A0A3P7Q625_DRAME|nr:unnamed protein product [Dracunculus medinensis]
MQITEIFQLSPSTVFFIGFIPPVIGAFLSIAIAFLFYNDEISNYNWQCGRARFPSLSRIINLPLGRIIWQISILAHVPVRFIELFTGLSRYKRLLSVNYKYKKYYELYRYTYFYSGMIELLLLSGVSIIGERERLHVCLFYLYGLFSMIFFISNIKCHRQSLYYLNPYGRISYYAKITLCMGFLTTAPILFCAFMLYWKACITVAYDIFALCEYLEVAFTILYHGCAFFDIRYKVKFSVRVAEEIQSIEDSTISANLQL